MRAMSRHLVVRDHRARRIRRRGDQRAARAPRPVARDRFRRELVVLRGADRHAERRAFEHPHEVAVARVARIGEQHLLVAVHQQRHHQQQRRRRARGDDDPLRRDVDAERVAVVARDRAAQLGKSERRRVADVAVGERGTGGVQHRARRREVGLADLHVHHVAAGGLERARGGLHLHHVKGRDVGNARGGMLSGLHRTDECGHEGEGCIS